MGETADERRGSGVSLRGLIGRLAGEHRPPDAGRDEPASRSEVAEYCGIRHPDAVEAWRVPVEEYHEGGIVRCERTGREPDPLEEVVARFEWPDGSREILSHRVFAAELADRYDLKDYGAEAYTLQRVGWTAAELHDAITSGPMELGEKAAEAAEQIENAESNQDETQG
jgi:hypothetical protein